MARSAAQLSTCFRAGRSLHRLVLSGTAHVFVQPAHSLRAFAAMPEMTGPPIGSERPRVVILGTGWAAARVAQVGIFVSCIRNAIVAHLEYSALVLE